MAYHVLNLIFVPMWVVVWCFLMKKDDWILMMIWLITAAVYCIVSCLVNSFIRKNFISELVPGAFPKYVKIPLIAVIAALAGVLASFLVMAVQFFNSVYMVLLKFNPAKEENPVQA